MAKEISDEEYTEFQKLQSERAGNELLVAASSFRADNPHIPEALLKTYQGDPEGFKDFGAELLKSMPKPAAPEPPPATAPTSTAPPPAGETPPTSPQPAPPPAAPTLPVVAPPSTPPIMGAQFGGAQSQAERERAYQSQIGLGAVQTPEAQQQNQPGVPVPIPQPGMADALTAANAVQARSEQIRERMRIGVAKPEEAQWLAQFGEKGFAPAVSAHGRRVAAIVGGRT